MMATDDGDWNDEEDVEPKAKKLKHGRLDHVVKEKRLIVVLERAQLEAAKVGRNFELLCSDKHASFLRKMKKDPSDYRPDITHQCLLMLLDSPLNREGLLQVFIHTERNVLIQINPQTRIPRTFDRFCGLMVQLLHKLSIRAADGNHKLLKVIKNPIESHLPVGCRKIGTSLHAESFPNTDQLVPTDGQPMVFVIGAMARGKVSVDYTEEVVKLSSYPLSAALACAKLTTAFEQVWNIR